MKPTLQDRIAYYNALIPQVYDTFPRGFALKPKDWIVNEELVNRQDISTVIDGRQERIRPISTMDVEFLSNDIVYKARAGVVDLVKNYPCGLNCPGCFSEEGVFGDRKNLMTWQEVMKQIREARDIGLQSIKFLGPGELFQNPDLFNILDVCENMQLPISIFTKGAELGDDDLARKNYGHLEITSAKDLVNAVAGYQNVRILLGFNSLFPHRQDAFVGSTANSTIYSVNNGVFEHRGIANYTVKRDKALVNLVDAGFSDPEHGQRLTLVMAPIYRNQVDEVVPMYEWTARRNIPLIIAPTMESGPKSQNLVQINMSADPQNLWISQVFVDIYSKAIDMGITTLDQIEQKGLSAYIGTEGCNQVANGLFLRLNGQVKMCPGTSAAENIYGNVHDTPLAKIWMQSPNYARGREMNNWCSAKSLGLPEQLQGPVIEQLEKRYGQK